MKERNHYIGLKRCMSQWILVICLILPHSEAVCNVGNCIPLQCNGFTCNSCTDGYYLQYGSSCIQCQQSLPGCATCSSSTSCTKCTDGYYLQSGSCKQCQQSLPGCATCSSSTSCTKCKEGYYLQSGSCKQCPDRCSTCTSSIQCTTCKDTYWGLQIDCPFTCSTNCTNNVCDDSTGFCHSCKPGTYGPLCGQDCNLCKDGQCDLRKCTIGCKDGYYQDNTASGYSYCWKCVYDSCITCSNATYCTQCEHGYYRNYFRLSDGRGRMNCLQCYESCLDCSSTEYCHKDCTQHCKEPVNPGTTKSTPESTTTQRTTSSFSTSMADLQTRTQKTSELFKSTATTPTEDCHCLNGELFEELNSCKLQIKTDGESEDQYQLTFGHGLATGIGITIVLFGSCVGIALLIRRRTKLYKHENEASERCNDYVNTNMTNILSVIATENNEVTNDIPSVSSDSANTGVTNIDSSSDYVSLGNRQTHESDYSDLLNT